MTRPNSTARGYDWRWYNTRRAFLEANPNCARVDCGEPATDVHHLDGKGPNGPRGHDHANLQGLCHSHHSQITARERPAGWNRHQLRRRPAERHPGAL